MNDLLEKKLNEVFKGKSITVLSFDPASNSLVFETAGGLKCKGTITDYLKELDGLGRSTVKSKYPNLPL